MSFDAGKMIVRSLDINLKSDYDILNQFCGEWVQTDRFWDIDEVGKSVRNSGALIFGLADDAGSVRSVAIFLMTGEVADLLYLYTRVSDRRLRMGESLLQQSLLRLSVNHAVKKVMLEVRKTNGSALSLYEKLGFEKLSVRPRYYRDGIDAVIMEWKSVELPNG
jgi:ribosomal-protein-alanine N-acetyltransferase